MLVVTSSITTYNKANEYESDDNLANESLFLIIIYTLS